MVRTNLSWPAEPGAGALVQRQPTGPDAAAPVEASEVPQGDALMLWRWLRRRSGKVGWRAAVDSLRPYSQTLWHALGEAALGLAEVDRVRYGEELDVIIAGYIRALTLAQTLSSAQLASDD